VARAIRILSQEMETAMALLGVTSVEQLGPEYVELVDGLSRSMVEEVGSQDDIPHLRSRL
jgi:isopentenyl diphosphate isomerase/L-lactate dehydrogenase-like FMN-dependent dehydrogenase